MKSMYAFVFLLASISAFAQQPFLTPQQWTALRNESSGAAPYENLRQITRLHRVPATSEFEQAAKFMLERALQYGLKDAHAEQFPIDGKTQYGLMRSYLGWEVEEGRLWEVKPQHALLGDWATDPIRLADYSHSAEVETGLVDVGGGDHEADYTGKDVRGKIVLAGGVLSRIQALAVIRFGAAGIVSDMPNQTTAWSGEDRTLVRWGHLDARAASGFAFMVSHETADRLRARLRAGESIVLNARVKAAVAPGHWTVVTGTIPGADAGAGEIVYSCHLDHQRPGANDNGSGCVTILESARILARLIESGALARPRRTLRFVWGPEVEGTMAFLARHPEIKERLRADIHMDMVGGDPFKNKSILHVTGTPWSLPSFVTDVGAVLAEAIRSGSAAYAEGEGPADGAVIETRSGAPGTRNEFLADVTPYSTGSDHDDYDSSTIAVPSLYLRDWPDIYIHTDHDSLQQIDPTKLRRVALLGAGAGYVYANLDAQQQPRLTSFLLAQAKVRMAQAFQKAMLIAEDPGIDANQAWYEADNLVLQTQRREDGVLRGLVKFSGGAAGEDRDGSTALADDAAFYLARLTPVAKARGARGESPQRPWAGDPMAARVPVRIGDFGPLTYQNDNVLLEILGGERFGKIKLLNSEATPLLNVQDQSELYAYEIVNFTDGRRTAGQIRDAVSAEYGPLSLEMVSDYLNACVEAKIMKWK